MDKFSGWTRPPSTRNQEANGSSQSNASSLQELSSTQLPTSQKEKGNAKLSALKKRIGSKIQQISTHITAPSKSRPSAALPKADLAFARLQSPLLNQQLSRLDQTVSGTFYPPISTSLSEQALAISEKPYEYLFQLAYFVGCENNRQPISFKSREEYIDSYLRLQANGFQNEFQIRHGILSRENDPGKKAAAQFFLPEIKKLYNELHTPNSLQISELSTNELAKKMGELKISGGITYAEYYCQEYDNFRISPEFAAANPKIIDYVEDYFHATRIFLAPETLKIYTHGANNAFKWLTTKTAEAIAKEHTNKFKGIGIDDVSEFCKVINVALKTRDVQKILGWDDSWREYGFNYKGMTLKLYVQCDIKSGEILNVDIPEQSSNNTLHPELSSAITGKNYSTLQRVAENMGMQPHALLTEIIQPQNYLRKSLVQKDAYIYRKIFNSDKAENISITFSAQIKNQQIIAFESGNMLDHLLTHFPEMEKIYARLEDEGWNINLHPGTVNFCNKHKKEIGIADGYWRRNLLNSPQTILNTMAHEMAHAEYKMKPTFSLDEYLIQNSLDEGNSLFSEYMLHAQSKDQGTKYRIMNALENHNGPYFKEQHQVYEEWKKDKIKKPDQADQIAIKAFGKLFSKYQHSGSPTGVTYEKIWKNWYETTMPDGSQNPHNLIAELLEKTPPPKIFNTSSGEWQPISTQNVSIIARLPKQTTEDKGKIIFFDKNAFLPTPNSDGEDPSRSSFNLIKTGLYHGNITFESDGDSKNTIANLQFNQHNIDYHIQLTFDETGHVSNLEINESESITFFLNT
ncbi:Glucose-1-phosphate thymidylyltransferase [Mycoavidus cysteinexigens]|uniref:Glucose-1-phosphate thymidylyltransferase n=1 Tax=Mycoavidus cysteinexigens TaxID=1553431 RepID=A0A2Z6EXS1_9BURK|nr:hypothetical protein [Mycoavidus cysteinexigens]BBE10241.1 Glucose-1-phosphate thymidylyltransferase [Mycoavidus cysteinexigens]GLR00658.1 hypothetical protein GCM10007934_04690 [Mycoavidus cysteinexigens]